MMNNDDIHLAKSSTQSNYSMQRSNSTMSPNDDRCIDLLEMINMDDNIPNVLRDSCNINHGGIILDGIESKDEDRFRQDIMSALEKKDLKKIVTLALSQSHGGQKMSVNDTMLAIEKGSNSVVDTNGFEKISNIIRTQPKNSASVLRATVAPIRNESIITNSSTSIVNYISVPNIPGSKSSSHVARCSVPQEFSEQDLQAIFSPETKMESNIKSHGSRSLPATPPISQVPSRPLSSSCVPHNSDQGYQTYQNPGANGAMSFVQFSNQAGPMMLHGGYGGGHMSQGVHGPHMQYQQNFLSNNGIMCIVTPSMPGEHVSQTPSNNYPFLVPQNVLISVSSGSGSSQSCQSVVTTCPMTSGPQDCTKTSMMSATTTPLISSSAHCSNLPRILPKPGNRNIAPKSQYNTPQYVTQSSLQPSQPQQFKRPTANRRTNVRPKANKSNKPSKDKDNIMKAWEMSNPSMPCEDQSFMTQLESDEVHMMQGTDVDDLSLFRGSEGGYSNMDCIGQLVSSEDFDHTDGCDHNITVFDGEEQKLFASIEVILGSLWQTLYAATTVLEPVIQDAVVETPIEYGRVYVQCIAPLARATVTRTPVSSHSSVVVVSKQKTVQNDLETVWSSGSSNSRMVQLLYAHLGPHSNLLSPLLKCLLPSSVVDMHELTEPLSVSTRISDQEDLMTEEDMMAEEDLMADISPVKRDPSRLANLDRLLESCQPPPSSLTSVSPSSSCHQDTIPDPLPPRIPFNSREDQLSLHAFSSDFQRGHYLPWLKRGKHKNSWTMGNSMVRNSRSLEVPPVTGEMRIALLNKKSNYREVRSKGHRKRAVVPKSDKYRRRMDRIRQLIGHGVSSEAQVATEVPKTGGGILKIRIHLTKRESCVASVTDSGASMVQKKIENAGPIGCLTVDTDLTPLDIDDSASRRPRHRGHKKLSVSKSRGISRISSSLRQLSSVSSDQCKNSDSSTKRIFCTPKEDRRSSVLHPQTPGASPAKQRHSPTKKKRNKSSSGNPPIIMKLSSKKTEAVAVEAIATEDTDTHTADSIKLFFRRSGQNTYKSQILSIDPVSTVDTVSEEAYQYSPAVNLAPPSQQRARPQQAVLQFSPTHSSSDSDIGVAHNEISSLLQRQEQREPLSDSSTINQATFPPLPVPYLVGTDPSVFMDPHEVELVVVKNSRYKKVCQRQSLESQVAVSVFADTNNSEVFVPGCFVEQDKSNVTWDRSSPSMPILAPQEPFAAAVDAKKLPKSSHPCSYSQSMTTQQVTKAPSQSFSEPSDRTQQSPLCMATNNGHNSQYSSSSTQLELMPPDPIKSPPYRQPSYHYPSNYNSSCYLGDSTNQSMVQSSIISSKSQMQSPGLSQQISVSSACSSQLPDYAYFHNSSQQSLQSLISSDASLYATPSSYQSVPEPIISSQPATKPLSKRSSSSSRNQTCDQQSLSSSSSKKRKETVPVPNSLSAMYPSMNSDLYNAAAQYQGLDSYYGSGFSNILGNMDQLKLYEQYAREYSLQMSSFCGPGTMPWNSAMAEYCKQAAVVGARNPGGPGHGSGSTGGGGGAGTPSPGPGCVNPLSTGLHHHSGSHHSQASADYSSKTSHSSVLDFSPCLDPYSTYSMSNPYSMYSSFGIPK